MSETLDDWLKSRPECVQKLAAEFPLGAALDIHGQLLFIIGYTEDDSLVVSPVHPGENYDMAYEMRQHLCARHVRDGINMILSQAIPK